MKKLSTYIFLFFLSFSAHSFAEDISDFEIEGMSIGDSLLDFYDKNEITKDFFYKNKKYYAFASMKYKSENYDGIQFHIKNYDKKYIIVAIEGMKSFDDDFNKCLKFTA